MPEALIFDLDGTLWDTVDTCARAWNRARELEGAAVPAVTPADVAGCMGLNAEELRARAFPSLGPEEGTRLVRACFAQEIEFLRSHGARIYPHVPEGLAALAERRPLFLVSNCDQPYLEAFFSITGLQPRFRDWECYGNTGRPKSANIRAVMERNRISSAIYIGDTESDERAAREAGTRFAFADYGFGRAKSWDWRFSDFPAIAREFSSRPSSGL
jgi:phosphoglycolate phosphatase